MTGTVTRLSSTSAGRFTGCHLATTGRVGREDSLGVLLERAGRVRLVDSLLRYLATGKSSRAGLFRGRALPSSARSGNKALSLEFGYILACPKSDGSFWMSVRVGGVIENRRSILSPSFSECLTTVPETPLVKTLPYPIRVVAFYSS